MKITPATLRQVFYYLKSINMKHLFIIVCMLMIACSKKEDSTPKSLTPHDVVWNEKLYCTYFYNPTTNDTFCHTILDRKQFDSLNHPYGLHLWCNKDFGTEYVGVQINDSTECK